jgi:hypothetical protein
MTTIPLIASAASAHGVSTLGNIFGIVVALLFVTGLYVFTRKRVRKSFAESAAADVSASTLLLASVGALADLPARSAPAAKITLAPQSVGVPSGFSEYESAFFTRD